MTILFEELEGLEEDPESFRSDDWKPVSVYHGYLMNDKKEIRHYTGVIPKMQLKKGRAHVWLFHDNKHILVPVDELRLSNREQRRLATEKFRKRMANPETFKAEKLEGFVDVIGFNNIIVNEAGEVRLKSTQVPLPPYRVKPDGEVLYTIKHITTENRAYYLIRSGKELYRQTVKELERRASSAVSHQ